ncbi:MAG: hypothetical protein AAGH99_02960 [Planctomycetota bacterium]
MAMVSVALLFVFTVTGCDSFQKQKRQEVKALQQLQFYGNPEIERDLETNGRWDFILDRWSEDREVEEYWGGLNHLRRLKQAYLQRQIEEEEWEYPDVVGLSLESPGIVQLTGTTDDAGRTFSFILTDHLAKRERYDPQGYPDKNAKEIKPIDSKPIESLQERLSIRVMPVGEKARITPLTYFVNPVENEIRRLEEDNRTARAEQVQLESNKQPLTEVTDERVAEAEKELETKQTESTEAEGKTKTAQEKLNTQKEELRKAFDADDLKKAPESSTARLFYNQHHETFFGNLKLTEDSFVDRDDAFRAQAYRTFQSGVGQNLKSAIDATISQIEAQIEGEQDQGEKTKKKEQLAAVQAVKAAFDGFSAAIESYAEITLETQNKAIQTRAAQQKLNSLKRRQAQLKNLDDSLKRVNARITANDKLITKLSTQLSDAQGLQKWTDPSSLQIQIDASDLADVQHIEIIAERFEKPFVPEAKNKSESSSLDIKATPGRGSQNGRTATGEAYQLGKPPAVLPRIKRFRVPVYRGVARTRFVVVPYDEVKDRFGKMFADTFIVGRVEVTNTDDNFPIQVYASSMWVKVSVATHRLDLKKIVDDSNDPTLSAKQRRDEKKEQKLYGRSWSNNPYRFVGERDPKNYSDIPESVDDLQREWIIFQTRFRPYTFRDILATFNAQKLTSWQSKLDAWLEFSGEILSGAALFTANLDYLKGVNFFNGIFRPAAKDILFRELVANLQDLEQSSFRDIEPVAPNSRVDKLVFLPRGFLSHIHGFDVHEADAQPGPEYKSYHRFGPAWSQIVEIRDAAVYVGGQRIIKSDDVTTPQGN